MTIEPFLTTDDVVAHLKVDRITVYRMAGAGKIPAVRVGRQWRFRKSEIDAWLARQESANVPSPLTPTAA